MKAAGLLQSTMEVVQLDVIYTFKGLTQLGNENA